MSVVKDIPAAVEIIDSGTDAAGWKYKKYSDGTAEASRTTSQTVNITTLYGSWYRSPELTYPGTPSWMSTALVSADISTTVDMMSMIRSVPTRIALLYPTQANNVPVTIVWRITGTWK